jgi:hypothetical protein
MERFRPSIREKLSVVFRGGQVEREKRREKMEGGGKGKVEGKGKKKAAESQRKHEGVSFLSSYHWVVFSIVAAIAIAFAISKPSLPLFPLPSSPSPSPAATQSAPLSSDRRGDSPEDEEFTVYVGRLGNWQLVDVKETDTLENVRQRLRTVFAIPDGAPMRLVNQSGDPIVTKRDMYFASEEGGKKGQGGRPCATWRGVSILLNDEWFFWPLARTHDHDDACDVFWYHSLDRPGSLSLSLFFHLLSIFLSLSSLILTR